MAAMKCILGLLVLLAVSAWAEDRDPSVSEQLEKTNKHMKRSIYGFPLRADIIVNTQRNADPCVLTGCKWPKASDGKVYVPYVISKQDFTSVQLTFIKTVLKSFSASTCVQFVSRTNQLDYVNIRSLDGCYSYVGRQGGAQVVSLQSNGCLYTGIIQHEMLHVLGFHHEQCRSDRDEHIQVLLENVITGLEPNFYKINTQNQGTPYDYGSIMHYGRLAFSKDNVSPTMVAIPNPNAVFGTATKMSQNDINRINLLYCYK